MHTVNNEAACVLDEMSEYFDRLKELIVNTSQQNQMPVVLIGHSMGNLVIQFFLKNLPKQWKEKYIKSFVSLAGPWGGAVKSVRLMTSG